MLPSFILALREGLEAALVIGIVIGVLRKMDKRFLIPAVWAGMISAIFLSFIAALGLEWVGASFEGQGEEIFEGISMLLAAGILTWMIFWMRKQAASMKTNIESEVRQATQKQGRIAIFFVAFLAVAREGIELALFLLAAGVASNPLQKWLGAGFGLILAAFLGWLFFTSSRKMSLARLFQVTNFLLILFAAGLVGMAIHEFNELGWIPALIEQAWNLEAFLPKESVMGLLLKALIGYDSTPSLSQVIGYLAYLIIVIGILLLGRKNKPGERTHEES